MILYFVLFYDEKDKLHNRGTETSESEVEAICHVEGIRSVEVFVFYGLGITLPFCNKRNQ